MKLKMASAAIVGLSALTAPSAQAEVTLFEPVEKSMEDLLNEGYSIGALAIGNDGQYHFQLHGPEGKKAVVCVVRSSAVNKKSISDCIKLN